MRSKRRIFQPIETAFFDAIHASPLDDSPRLIYADWLEEYGIDPQYAELIRLAVQQKRATATSEEVKARIKELEQKVRRRYVSPLPPRTKLTAWHRGLPWITTTTNGIWAEHIDDFAEDCAQRMSPMFSFSLLLAYQSADALKIALAHPLMKQIHDVCFHRRPATSLEDAKIIASSVYFSRLESIQIYRADPNEGKLILTMLSGYANVEVVAGGFLLSSTDNL